MSNKIFRDGLLDGYEFGKENAHQVTEYIKDTFLEGWFDGYIVGFKEVYEKKYKRQIEVSKKLAKLEEEQ